MFAALSGEGRVAIRLGVAPRQTAALLIFTMLPTGLPG